MTPFNQDNFVDSDKFTEEAYLILIEATQIAVEKESLSLKCKPGHLLLALWPTLDKHPDWRRALEDSLGEGCQLWEIPAVIKSYIKDTDHEQMFEMKREDFDQYLIKALEACDEIENDMGDTVWAADRRPIEILPLWISIFNHPSPEDKEGLAPVLDFERAADAFVRLLVQGGMEAEPTSLNDLYTPEGALRLDFFDDVAVDVLEAACELAGGNGYDRVRSPHLLIALLERPDGIAEEVIRLQAKPGVGPKTVCEALIRAISRGPSAKVRQLSLDRYHLSEMLQDVLQQASLLSVQNEADAIGERFLLRVVLKAEHQGIGGRCLTNEEFGFKIDQMIQQVDRLIVDYRLGRAAEEVTPFLIPGDVAKSEDFTYLAHSGQIKPSVGQDELIEQMLRGLHKRQNNNVMITGEMGIGKTELVRELSRRIAKGDVPFLKRKKVVWVNCDGIPPDQSRARFYDIVGTVKNRNNIILCLDHFDGILRYAGGNESHNRGLFRVALRNRDIHLIAIIANRHYMELLSHDYGLLEMFTRVEVGEPTIDQTVAIIDHVSKPTFERLYGVSIAPRAVARSANASREFIMSERLPVKAIKVLRDACERVNYDIETGKREDNTVKDEDIVWAVSKRTSIDEGTIAGSGSRMDFRSVLESSVVGQDQAVQAVADRLQFIKSGSVDPDLPAAVFLFAGLTGTGKTELAKAIARVYSTSGKLSVYPMMNFTETHSISGITGVPPGYVGYEAGGRLINDLNADPYGVVLFDEAEEAHPDIWQAMLSLFDEAWIEDRRNVKAWGNRAIFILTSNAGQEFIRQNYKSMDLEKLKEKVAKQLVEFKNRRGERVFSPEFLGRINRCGGIVIFNPLSKEAMGAIASLHIQQLSDKWTEKRDKTLIVDPEVIKRIGELSYAENEKYSGTRGGRIVQNYIDKMVEKKLLDKMTQETGAMSEATTLRVSLAPMDDTIVHIEDRVRLPLHEATAKAEKRLRSILPPDLNQTVARFREEVQNTVEDWKRQVCEALPEQGMTKVNAAEDTVRSEIEKRAGHLNETIEMQRQAIIEAICAASSEQLETDGNRGKEYE